MVDLTDSVTRFYRAEWRALGAPRPLEVCRSGYDDAIVSWEVLWHETPFCDVPIAEFDTWAEAQSWADTATRFEGVA